MKRVFTVLLMVFIVMPVVAAEFSCGPGYVLASRSGKVDGLATRECQKLWCRDLETNTSMGSGDRANSGYTATNGPNELTDASGKSIMCWGTRKWCGGEVAGQWNPQYGAYTRNGADNAVYSSYKKGSCFAWRLGKPECPDGETAILVDDKEWVCSISSGVATVNRASGVRRTGTLRRTIR